MTITFLQQRAARSLLGDLRAAGFKDLSVEDVAQDLGLVREWKRGQLTQFELSAHTGWGDRGQHTLIAAKAFQDAMYELGAGMVRDFRAGRSEKDIVDQAAFALSKDQSRRLLHASRLLHDALEVLQPWMREPDGPVALVPSEMRGAKVFAQWTSEDEAVRRHRLTGMDDALRAAGIGYRDDTTKAPLNEQHLTREERPVVELYWLDAPDLLESGDR